MEGDKHMGIFKSICDLVTKPEFQNDQMSFFEANYQHFNEEDENKLEYTTIYEQYVEIMDRTIQTKLMDEYQIGEEDIKSFLSTFEEQIETYKKENSEVVDILFGYVDFQIFKKAMMTYKKGIVNKKESATTEEENSIQSTAGSTAEDCYTSFLEIFNEPLSNWTKKFDQGTIKNGYNLKIHQRKMPGQKTDVLRVDSTMVGI